MFISQGQYEKMYDKIHELSEETINLTELNRQLKERLEASCKTIDDLKADKQLLLDKNFNLTCHIRKLEEEIDSLKHPKTVKCCRRICCKGE